MRAVVLHPHPDMGGTRHDPVVTSLARALVRAHTFDFVSSDVAVAVGQTLGELGEGPLWLAGYSFGGGIASMVDDAQIRGWILVAPALSMVDPVIGDDPRPKLVVSCEHDTFFPPQALHVATEGWAATTHVTIGGADHFLRGHEHDVAARSASWVLQFRP